MTARAIGVALFLACGAAQAQPYRPYPQQPYPPQPYPQQPYPQQPYAPYPPPPPPPQPPPPAPPPSKSDTAGLGGGADIAVGAGFARGEVDQGNKYRTVGGGLFLHGAIMGMGDVFNGRARLTGLLGGGGGGEESMVAVDAYGGAGLAFANAAAIFLRAGIEGYGIKNDEIGGSTTVFGAQSGLLLWVDGFGFDLGPRVGFSGRTEYEPGDESQGRRYWRRMGGRGVYGGLASIVSDHFSVHGSMLRVADSDPLSILEGNACLSAFKIAICGFAQYWRSIASPDFGGDAKVIPFTYIGGAIGFGTGIAGSKDRIKQIGK